MFRRRDLVALAAATLLARVAWHENWHVRASADLLFYFPTGRLGGERDGSHAKALGENQEGGPADDDQQEGAASPWRRSFLGPAMLDVDGDGTAEAWVVLTEGWKIRVLDLKPGQGHRGGPILPPILLESAPIANLSEPVAIATGHLPDPTKPSSGTSAAASSAVDFSSSASSSSFSRDTHVDERTRRYFCGTDWHDASVRCGHPCPDGDSTKCPGNERCFADTPCDFRDYLSRQEKAQQEKDRSKVSSTAVTPAGSIPVVVTVWEHGVVRCDGLVVPNATHRLEIQPLWMVQPLVNLTSSRNGVGGGDHRSLQYWFPSSIQFVDPVGAGTPRGLVLVTANLLVHEDDDDVTHVVLAMDAGTGAVLWETLSEQVYGGADGGGEPLPLPVRYPDQSSAARRRTLLSPPSSSSSVEKALPVPNCLHSFRRSLLTSGALPHYHGTDEDDVRSYVAHFDPQLSLIQQRQHQRQQRKATSAQHPNRRATQRQPRRQQLQRRPVYYGRPNVVITHTDKGLSVRSLKNGHELCRLSLWDQTLYADVNHDGLLDSLHVVTAHRLEDDDAYRASAGADPHRAWIRDLADRVQGEEAEKDGARARRKGGPLVDLVSTTDLCHLQVLSGLPSREELFSTHVCGSQQRRQQPRPDLLPGDAAPPLPIETYGGRQPGSDIVTAVPGVVTRVDGRTGRKQWQFHDESFLPHWDHSGPVLLSRIDADFLPSHARPILLAGESGLAVLSPRGKPMATAPFPQPARSRPILMDVNGDGVDDVVVVTTDAVWAYAVRLRATGTSPFRLAVGLLLMGVLLALVRNRFQVQSGKRSTDL